MHASIHKHAPKPPQHPRQLTILPQCPIMMVQEERGHEISDYQQMCARAVLVCVQEKQDAIVGEFFVAWRDMELACALLEG